MPLKKLDISGKRDADILRTHSHVAARLARSNFSRLVDSARIDNVRVIITEHGEPAAAIVPISDIRTLDEMPVLDWVDKISDAQFKEMSLDQFKSLLRNGQNHQNSNEKDSDHEHSS